MATAPQRKRPLTIKRAKFVKAVAEGKPKYKAAQEAFGIEKANVAAVRATNELKNVNVQAALQEALAKQGITIDLIVKPIADGLKANKIITSEDEAVETDLPDHSIRLKSSQMAMTLLGVKSDGGGNTYNFFNIAAQEQDDYGI